jgi:hypothetical protein
MKNTAPERIREEVVALKVRQLRNSLTPCPHTFTMISVLNHSHFKHGPSREVAPRFQCLPCE